MTIKKWAADYVGGEDDGDPLEDVVVYQMVELAEAKRIRDEAVQAERARITRALEDGRCYAIDSSDPAAVAALEAMRCAWIEACEIVDPARPTQPLPTLNEIVQRAHLEVAASGRFAQKG